MRRGSSLPAAKMAAGDRDARGRRLARDHRPRPRMERGRRAQALPPAARGAGPRGSVVERAAAPAVGAAVHMSRTLRVPIFPLAGRDPVPALAAAAAHLRAALSRDGPGRDRRRRADRDDPAAAARRRQSRAALRGRLRRRDRRRRGAGRRPLQHRPARHQPLPPDRARPRSTRAYRCAEVDIEAFDDSEPPPLALVQRAEVEREARRLGDALGLAVDWAAVGRLDDEMLVNAIAQVAPFDIGAKQALLEAADARRPRRPAGPADAVPPRRGDRRRRDRADASVD